MKTEEIKRKFLENNYHNFDMLNSELNILYNSVDKSIKNNYENLLYSNTNNRNLLKKLSIEEIFLMNLPDNAILSILNISIYEAIINKKL
ncbi:hypothetical protein FACS1894151_01060 [Spirochaetia bacterium]|nr:hypothetical protein FACS1894151_01060 [Spirochaetia bacterium]